MNPRVELELSDFKAFYGSSQIIYGIDLKILPGEVVGLIGRNGVGKSTLIRGILGITCSTTGQIALRGEKLQNLPTAQRVCRGIAYCPDDRGVFSSLTVLENLLLPFSGSNSEEKKYLDEAFQLFPVLQQKCSLMGSHISGGEQQMLAIARTLARPATLLIYDEPTEGLAPLIVQKILEVFKKLKEKGKTMLLAEQNFHFCQKLCTRFLVMDQGKIVDEFPNEKEFLEIEKIQKVLGLADV